MGKTSAQLPAFGNQVLNQQLKSDLDISLLDAILDSEMLCIMVMKSVRSITGEILDFEYTHVNRQAEKTVNRDNLKGRHFLEVFPCMIDNGLFQKFVKVT